MTSRKKTTWNKKQLLAEEKMQEIAGEIQESSRLEGAVLPSSKEIEQLGQFLSLYTAPEATEAGTEKLLASLLPASSLGKIFNYSFSWIAKVIVMQARFFPITFWLGAAFFVLLGLLASPHFRPGEINLMIAVIPWLGSLSIFFGLGQSRGVWGELETLTPLPAHILALGRTFAALGIDTLIALSATALAAFLGLESNIWGFTISWLVPLLLSTSLAFLLVLAFDIQKALAVTTVFWGVQIIFQQRIGLFSFLSLPGDPLWAASKGLGLLLTGFCLLAVYFYLRSPHCEVKRLRG